MADGGHFGNEPEKSTLPILMHVSFFFINIHLNDIESKGFICEPRGF